MDEQTALGIMRKVMPDETPLLLEMRIREAWFLVSALQLASRHPDMSAPQKAQLTVVGQQIQDAIVERHPEAEAVLEMGWDEQYDVAEGGQTT